MASTTDIYEYHTLAGLGIGEYKDRGSKFIGLAYPVSTETEVEAILDQLRKEHLKARHYCYAYILDRYQLYYRANDDGEPSGTAGKPILGQLQSAEVVEALVVVIRYYGGTKLGTSGLIQAYRGAAELAIADAGKRLVQLSDTYQLTINYAEMGHVLDCIKSLGIEITDKAFGETAVVTISIPSMDARAVITQMQASILQVSTDQITAKTTIDYCTIETIETHA